MKQADLHRAVARATGESVDRIQRMGFTLTVTVDAPINTDRKCRFTVVCRRRRREGRKSRQVRSVV